VTAWQFDMLFHLPPESTREAKLLLLVVGIGSALGVPVGVFAGFLEGFQEFVWINAVQMVSAGLRAVLIVFALNSGYGLVALGIITVGLNVGGSLVYALIAFKTCPRLRVRYTYVRMSTLRTLGGFGFVVFWIGLAQQLRFQTDSVIIGSLLSVQAISLFGIGAKLVAYTTDAVQATAQVFTPMSSRLDATGSLEGLRRVLVTGNRYSSFVILPLATILLVTGKSIILVWVGEKYLSSYTVLAILIIPTTLYLMQAASTKVLYGMARHRPLAVILVLEGAANVLLSVVLARHYGLNGVALGTAIPLACTSVLFLPIHVCRVLGLRLRNYMRSAFSYPVVLSVPLALVLWISDSWIRPHNYPELLLILSLGGLAYVPGVLAYFYFRERKEFIDGPELQSSSSASQSR